MVGIGFFAPLPLALMMPFMAGQSMLMGDAFGKAYQYGKRKISAMSNEEFNKLTPEMLGQSIVTDYNAIIPSLEQAVQSSTEFQRIIIQELGNILKSIPADVLKFFGLENLVDQGTDDTGRITVSLAVVKNWTISQLKIAFENELETYSTLSKTYIKSEYERRISQGEPDPVIEPEPDVINKTRAWYEINAQGRVSLNSITGKYAVYTNNNGVWKLFIEFTPKDSDHLVPSIENAVHLWPFTGYVQFGFTNPTAIYWTLKTKI